MTDTLEPLDFPLVRKCPLAPPAEYAELRENNPVFRVKLRINGKEFWAVTKHEHVRQVLGDETMSSNWKNPAYPLQVPVPPEILQILDLPLVALDPPVHTLMRRMLAPEFSAKRVQAMRPAFQKIVDEHVDALLEQGGPVDLVEHFALPVTSLVFCSLLGISTEDIPFFRKYAYISKRASENDTSITPDVIQTMHIEMEQYLYKLIAEKTASPGDDMTSRVVARCREEESIEDKDILGLLRVMVVGGLESTTAAIALGVLALLENPDQLELIKNDPSLTWDATAELVRYTTLSDSTTARAVTRDIEVGGVQIKAGEGIICLNGSANRDPSVFPDPEKLDITRDTSGLSSFGYGIHQCMGSGVARLQLEIAINTLFARIPGLKLDAPVDELPFERVHSSYSLTALPVTW